MKIEKTKIQFSSQTLKSFQWVLFGDLDFECHSAWAADFALSADTTYWDSVHAMADKEVDLV